MAKTITYNHAKSDQIAIICSPFSKKKKFLYGDDWTLKDWNKICKFWSKHPTFSIHVE